MKKLAVVTTHPIQYYAPVFRQLTANGKIQLKVFYTWEKGTESFDKGFGKVVAWDIPLLEGYDHEFVSNGGKFRKDFRGVVNPGLIAAIDRYDPDAVLVYGWNYRSHLRAIRHYHQKKTVLFRGDSTLLDEQGGVKKMLRTQWLKWVYSHVDKALYVGANNKAYYLKHGLREDRLHFVPHAIDNSRFTDNEAAHHAAANELVSGLGIRDNAIRVIFVGKFQPKKNPSLLIDAFMRPELDDMKLIMVGDGEQQALLQEKAKGAANIFFLPFQNQTMMPAIYRMGEIFCLPSQGPGETWGLAVNEAMACGRAILASNKVGCAADLVQDGKNGFVFASGNAGSLVNCLLKLKDRPTLQAMGWRSKEIIQDWSLEKQVQRIESLQYDTRSLV